MKRIIQVILSVIVIISLILPVFPAYAASVQVSMPNFPITLNGIPVNNATRQYPFIVYKGITYFPMTYHDCRFLGLESTYSTDTGLGIMKTGVMGDYSESLSFVVNPKIATAQTANFKVNVNGKDIDNSKEEYPLLSYHSITYFPLTWRFAVDEFDWSYNFDSIHGLEIDSIAVESVAFEPSAVYVYSGDTLMITPKIYPKNAANRRFTFKSSNESVATVSNEGLIYARNTGTTNITFTTANGKNATSTVTVLETTQVNKVSNWSDISPIQQFSYKKEGLAFAYAMGNHLVITTPNTVLSVEMKYPLLGDVLADDDGNFYIVWGKANETNNASVETVFISKYSPDGHHMKTTGFIGESSPWGTSDSAKTKSPFDNGGCVSVIAKGVLVNYHSKHRYDGHQSDSAIAVNIADMSVYRLPNNVYSGHSFNQSVIYSEKASDFLFASQGDAFARGLRVNRSSGSYGDTNEILFHSYLEANADYNMWIVNKTFMQLGGLAETSSGIALVGASAMSISEAAKTEKQNLFVQIFDPLAGKISPSMFLGGTTRNGATATDIYDRNNSPLTRVTDYGVRWLTNYADTDAIAPQVVSANDRLVILWSTKNDTFYMVLAANGDVLVSATSLKGLPLNSFERPVYHNGAVYWVAITNGVLGAVSVMIE